MNTYIAQLNKNQATFIAGLMIAPTSAIFGAGRVLSAFSVTDTTSACAVDSYYDIYYC